MLALLLGPPEWREVNGMDWVLQFMFSVIAGILANQFCKWLDGE